MNAGNPAAVTSGPSPACSVQPAISIELSNAERGVTEEQSRHVELQNESKIVQTELKKVSQHIG